MEILLALFQSIYFLGRFNSFSRNPLKFAIFTSASWQKLAEVFNFHSCYGCIYGVMFIYRQETRLQIVIWAISSNFSYGW
ncbi:hypothetical protein NIES4074_22440 [Cylindrospermum sp. NIES-4074]|nr:hypothetical protein NIES4074_22440 [Cylindrospermum sp. NIES-4074]